MMHVIMDDGSLVIQDSDRTDMVITDLHLGFSAEISQEKKVVIPAQANSILYRIGELVGRYKVDTLYLIGDIKHSIQVDQVHNWETIPKFMTQLSKIVTTKIIPGNHDGELKTLIPRNIQLLSVKGIQIKKGPSIGLLHGHAWPSAEVLSSDIIIVGHSHPSIRRIKRVTKHSIKRDIIRYTSTIPVILKTKLYKNCVRDKMNIDTDLNDAEGALIVLPAFNRLISGSSINTLTRPLGGLFFERGCADTDNAEVYSCNEIYLGRLDELRARFNEMLK
ncbi:MAG: hypothetical protein GF411_06575 [Candidatus Lokiarchaeota archaeon]|nr:hypothetical protein [Candidatus Lokiarchaeota archaeon]